MQSRTEKGGLLGRLQREAQFLKYVNRFGPGAVIYWFGFVEDLADTDADILLLQRFPPTDEVVQLHRLPLVTMN